ncbi:hypothetical protein [Streptomyces sp. QHH-9511]|uniref:hypothetical protein n=1 Tax=Streptomyces sp. QHH-9511 TaxID=2684468 RepID=UPI001E5BF3E0|nr:hypothetical protein [Streptomyces sp. QHH-9511]
MINGPPNVNNVPAAQQRIYDGRSLMFSQGPSWINREWWWDTNSDLTQLSPGSSGGPWFKDFNQATGEGVLVGVTSHLAQSSTGGLDAIAEAEGRAPSPVHGRDELRRPGEGRLRDGPVRHPRSLTVADSAKCVVSVLVAAVPLLLPAPAAYALSRPAPADGSG